MFKRSLVLASAFLVFFSSFAQAQQEKFEPGSVYLFEEYYDNNLAKLLDPRKIDGSFVLDVRSFDVDLSGEKLVVNAWAISKFSLGSVSGLNLNSIAHLEIGLSHWNTILFIEMGYIENNGVVSDRKAYRTIYGRQTDSSGKTSYGLIEERRLIN